MADWSFSRNKNISGEWPCNEAGEPENPVFLMHTGGSVSESEMTVSMLNAYGVPTLCDYPNDGTFGKLIIGLAGTGIDVYVPETMLEDAQNILSADIEEGEE